MIPDDQVDEVRARADIVDIVSEHVQLKKSGKEYKANCPFHDERTPSFYVVPDKGFYKCFGCGKSGDVFSFVMERMGLDFVEAVRHVAARSGIEIREVSREREEEDPHRALYELNTFAREFFRKNLTDPETGAVARKYLADRGVTEEVAERFGLGWAPDEWTALRDTAAKLGLDEDLMVEVGLLGRRERTGDAYDRFRGRIIFPIEGLSGKVVGFGGRILAQDRSDAPKYLNSPETPIYHKGSVLYGLSGARHTIRREECALVVEGYMDVVSLASHGFGNAVAPLGTAMTEEQARLLSRYTTKVVLLFDSDSAGLKATFRAGDVLLAEKLHPAAATLPPGEDPDSLVRSEGAEALQRHLDDAMDVLDRKLQILEEKGYFRSIERTRSAVDRVLPTLRAAADPALRDIYVAKVSDRTGVRRDTLEEEIRKEGRRTRAVGTPPPAQTAPRGRPPSTVLRMGPERELLAIMIRNPEYVERVAEWLGPDDFVDSAYRAIFQTLLDDPELRSPPPSMDPVAAARFTELLNDPAEIPHVGRVFEKAVTRIRAAALDARLEALHRRVREATDETEKRTLAQEKFTLSKELRDLDPEYWASTLRRIQNDPQREQHNP
ncbi:MAG: DNA primase [Gemmatimonadota bacterium]|nr:DNA primase [Gemmatimonadota bacterium]MDH5759357.1 DNA primase [Gemmatimonadota bacterium]